MTASDVGVGRRTIGNNMQRIFRYFGVPDCQDEQVCCKRFRRDGLLAFCCLR